MTHKKQQAKPNNQTQKKVSPRKEIDAVMITTVMAVVLLGILQGAMLGVSITIYQAVDFKSGAFMPRSEQLIQVGVIWGVIGGLVGFLIAKWMDHVSWGGDITSGVVKKFFWVIGLSIAQVIAIAVWSVVGSLVITIVGMFVDISGYQGMILIIGALLITAWTVYVTISGEETHYIGGYTGTSSPSTPSAPVRYPGFGASGSSNNGTNTMPGSRGATSYTHTTSWLGDPISRGDDGSVHRHTTDIWGDPITRSDDGTVVRHGTDWLGNSVSRSSTGVKYIHDTDWLGNKVTRGSDGSKYVHDTDWLGNERTRRID